MALSRLHFGLALCTLACLAITNSLTGAKECAVFYSDRNFNGDSFTFMENEELMNIVSDNGEEDSFRKGWTNTGSAQVKPGCTLHMCNDLFFSGKCIKKTAGSYPRIKMKANESIVAARCECEKECRCEDVFMKKESCARAYLDDSCTKCDTFYAELSGNNSDFSKDFKNRVKAFRVRKGCTVSLYEEEDFEGEEEIITEESVPEYNRTVGSFECSCKDRLWRPRIKPPRPASYPPLINITGTLDGVLEMLSNESLNTHPGLRAALSSLQNKRSSKNAYILLLGSTGAGKSHTINVLFDNPNICKVGFGKSVTKEINEYRISVPIDDIGVQNSELRIIDTPGLGDTGGLYEDAKFLASLDAYLSNHEELNERIPNIVLIFHKFHDNRVDGEGSIFVKMLRGLDAFRQKITDESYSNVIFVFSHFNYALKKDKKKPEERLAMLQSIIENFSLFPKPTTLAVAENRGQEQDLPMLNGYVQLPNGEYYPRNLFDKIELVTEKGGDMIGRGVISQAFRDSEDFIVTNTSFPILQTSDKLDYFYRILQNAVFAIQNTEISQILKETWDNEISEDIKRNYPTSLTYLQKALNIRNVNTKDDLPKTFKDILALLTALNNDQATLQLISKGLNIRLPDFPSNVEVGYSFNVFKDSVLPASPFNMEIKSGSDIGFLVPTVLSCELNPSIAEKFEVFPTKSKYIINRLESLGISGTIPESNFTGQVKPGNNIQTDATANGGCLVSATREFRLYKFLLNEHITLTEEFTQAVKKLPNFNASNYENVDEWKHFFNNYGTHVVNWAYVGGSIEVELKSNKTFDLNVAQSLFNLIKFAEEIPYKMFLENSTSYNLTEAKTVLPQGTTHTLKFLGGDKTYYTNDLTELSIEQASKLITNWKNSLKYYPVVLNSDMNLIPISNLAKRIGQKYASEIEKASQLLFNSELKYIPPPKREAATGGRDNTKLIGELLQAQREASEQFQKTIFQMQAENQKREQKLRDDQIAILRDMIKSLSENKENKGSKQPEKPKSSCLKQGTLILMGDLVTKKPVETIQVGDMVADMNLNPAKVLGVSFEFLLNRKFYGFNNETSFFTSTHLFAGPPNQLENRKDIKIFAQDTQTLFKYSPLMTYLNVTDFANTNSKTTTYLYTFNKNYKSQAPVSDLDTTPVQVYEDKGTYDGKTLVYFLEVDSTTGTYFANGYVCRHELPPFEHWPKTMGLLFRLLDSPAFKKLALEPYDIPTVNKIDNIAINIASTVEEYMQSRKQSQSQVENSLEEMHFKDVDMNENISGVFSNPLVTAFSFDIYSKVGPVLAPYLDHEVKNSAEIAYLQHELLKLMNDEINKHFDF